MKKNLVLMIGLFLILLNGNIWGAQPADTGAPFALKPANVIVVAKSGGDYTSISAALDAIEPTADNPYVIKVMPGVYVHNESVNMKSYVHLQGAGRDVTRIVYENGYIIKCNNLLNVTISGFTLEGYTGILNNGSSSLYITGNFFKTFDDSSISNYNASSIITDNVIEEGGGSGGGIWNYGDSSPIISGNKIIGIGGMSFGIRNEGSSSPTITNNVIKGARVGIGFAGGGGMVSSEKSIIDGNIIEGNQTGIYHHGVSTIIANNTIRGNSIDGISINSYGWGNRPDGSFCCISASTINGNIISDNGRYGIYSSSSTPIITHNKVTSNAMGDMYLTTWAETTTNVGFNVYDIISGSGVVGGYNLKSDGTLAPLP